MRVVVAMSGGVDSSVAASVLKDAGHEVIGATVKTWPKEECGLSGDKMCCSLDAVQYARSACEDLDIPFYVIDLSDEFAGEVRDYFAKEYTLGRTPNPCVYCNSRIKFGYLLKKAREMGGERLCTGHYAKIRRENNMAVLCEADDKHQDQSYFLYDIPRENLSALDFPLGAMSKKKVREIALEKGFMSAYRKSSQDICFAGEDGDYRGYLKKMGIKCFDPGDILDTSGKVVGKHKGIAYYTLGQRKGIGVSSAFPLYVVRIDAAENTITVGERKAAMCSTIRIKDVNWLLPGSLITERNYNVRIRYNSEKSDAIVKPLKNKELMVIFEKSQFAPTPGQAAVIYDDDVVVGGGWIEEIIRD